MSRIIAPSIARIRGRPSEVVVQRRVDRVDQRSGTHSTTMHVRRVRTLFDVGDDRDEQDEFRLNQGWFAYMRSTVLYLRIVSFAKRNHGVVFLIVNQVGDIVKVQIVSRVLGGQRLPVSFQVFLGEEHAAESQVNSATTTLIVTLN